MNDDAAEAMKALSKIRVDQVPSDIIARDQMDGLIFALADRLAAAQEQLAALPDNHTLRQMAYDAHGYRMEGQEPEDIELADKYAEALADLGGLPDPAPADRVGLSPGEMRAIEDLHNQAGINDLAAVGPGHLSQDTGEPEYDSDDLIEQDYCAALDRLTGTYGITDEPEEEPARAGTGLQGMKEPPVRTEPVMGYVGYRNGAYEVSVPGEETRTVGTMGEVFKVLGSKEPVPPEYGTDREAG
jgi:hypothetical protein